MGCTGAPGCTEACATEIGAASADQGLQLILAVSACTYQMNSCKSCRVDGGTTDGGSDASSD